MRKLKPAKAKEIYAEKPAEGIPANTVMEVGQIGKALEQIDLAQARAKVAEALIDEKKIPMFSDLSDGLTRTLAAVYVVGKEMECPAFTEFGDILMRTRISKNGVSREQLVRVASSPGENKDEDGMNAGLVAKLRARLGI